MRRSALTLLVLVRLCAHIKAVRAAGEFGGLAECLGITNNKGALKRLPVQCHVLACKNRIDVCADIYYTYTQFPRRLSYRS